MDDENREQLEELYDFIKNYAKYYSDKYRHLDPEDTESAAMFIGTVLANEFDGRGEMSGYVKTYLPLQLGQWAEQQRVYRNHVPVSVDDVNNVANKPAKDYSLFDVKMAMEVAGKVLTAREKKIVLYRIFGFTFDEIAARMPFGVTLTRSIFTRAAIKIRGHEGYRDE